MLACELSYTFDVRIGSTQRVPRRPFELEIATAAALFTAIFSKIDVYFSDMNVAVFGPRFG